MKLLIVLLTLISSVVFAETLTSSRGYLADKNGSSWYFGLNDSNNDAGFNLDYALQKNSITNEQIDAMYECMKKKNTHAIQVINLEEKVSVPTGMGNKPTKITDTVVDEVNCIRAPGFLQLWRNFFN